MAHKRYRKKGRQAKIYLASAPKNTSPCRALKSRSSRGRLFHNGQSKNRPR